MSSPIEAARAAVREIASSGDLGDPRTRRRLQKALQGLAVVEQAFADEADETDAVLRSRPRLFAPSDDEGAPSDSGMAANPVVLGLGGGLYPRQEPMSVAETFQSRLLREIVSAIPAFLDQGRQQAEGNRARAASDLSFAIRRAESHGDHETAKILREELRRLVVLPAPTGSEVASGAADLFQSLPAVTRVTAGALYGMASNAGNAPVSIDGDGADKA